MTADRDPAIEIAALIESATAPDNALDVLCEIALFRPDEAFVAIRANAAGTKVIYTDRTGTDRTYWADDWTATPKARELAAQALRRRAAEVPCDA